MRNDRWHLPAGECDVLARQLVDSPGSGIECMVERKGTAVTPVPILECVRTFGGQHLLIDCLTIPTQAHCKLWARKNKARYRRMDTYRHEEGEITFCSLNWRTLMWKTLSNNTNTETLKFIAIIIINLWKQFQTACKCNKNAIQTCVHRYINNLKIIIAKIVV